MLDHTDPPQDFNPDLDDWYASYDAAQKSNGKTVSPKRSKKSAKIGSGAFGRLRRILATALPPAQKWTLFALALRADRQGDCWPTVKTIANDASLSESTVNRALKHLRGTEYLTVTPRYDPETKERISSRYHLSV